MHEGAGLCTLSVVEIVVQGREVGQTLCDDVAGGAIRRKMNREHLHCQRQREIKMEMARMSLNRYDELGCVDGKIGRNDLLDRLGAERVDQRVERVLREHQLQRQEVSKLFLNWKSSKINWRYLPVFAESFVTHRFADEIALPHPLLLQKSREEAARDLRCRSAIH